MKSSKVMDRRTGKLLSLEVKSGHVFESQEDEEEAVDAISAYRVSGGCAAQLRSFMDGFWDLIGRKDTFKAYTQDEVRMFIGGISEFWRFVPYYFFFGSNLSFPQSCAGMNTRNRAKKNQTSTSNGSGKSSTHGLSNTAKPCSTT